VLIGTVTILLYGIFDSRSPSTFLEAPQRNTLINHFSLENYSTHILYALQDCMLTCTSKILPEQQSSKHEIQLPWLFNPWSSCTTVAAAEQLTCLNPNTILSEQLMCFQ